MNGQPLDPAVAAPARNWRAVLCLAAILVVALMAISGRSLWIDEACTSMKAVAPTLTAWWQELAPDRGAELQFPFYMLYIWGWARLFGSSEWSLHAANVPWFVAGAAAFILAFPHGDRRWPMAAWAALVCPFAWYYLDEARPYAMQIGASLAAATALARLSEEPRPAGAGDAAWMRLYMVAIVALAGSNLLGMVWAGAGLAAMPALLPVARVLALVKRHWVLCLAASGLLLLLAGYYVWTLTIGARATAVATTTWGSALFVGYELLGFSGLGPGRLEMRSAGPAALRSHWPWLALYALVIALVLGSALLCVVKDRNRRLLAAGLCCLAPAGFILGIGWVVHFRAVGRHFTPLITVLLLLLTSGLGALWSRRSAWARGAVLLFCALSLVSCLSLRFSPRHEKDNYRAAAALARTALRDGQVVWWNAAVEGARYYRVPLATRPGADGAALLVANPVRATLDGLPLPQTVIASKPDVYDDQGVLVEFLRERGLSPVASFAAFVIYGRNKQ